MRDFSEPRKEEAVPQGEAEDAIDELLKLLTQELHKRKVQGNLHSSSYGTLTPEYKMPRTFTTKVHHHHHYHYNSPSVSPPPIINKNIVRINNKNTTNGSDSSESGDNEGEY